MCPELFNRLMMDWWTYIMQTEQHDKEIRTVCPWHEIIIHTLMFIKWDWESQIKSLPKSKLTWAVGGHKQVCDSDSAGRVWLGTFDANCVFAITVRNPASNVSHDKSYCISEQTFTLYLAQYTLYLISITFSLVDSSTWAVGTLCKTMFSSMIWEWVPVKEKIS